MNTPHANYTVKFFGDTYSLCANWADASSPIERGTEDGWVSTGRQVGDYCHSARAAMRDELEMSLVVSGDLPADHVSEIESALSSMATS